MDRLARALRLVEAFRSQGSLATRDVVRILRVDRKTALRDLEALREAGVPLEPTGEGVRRRWVADPAWKRSGLSVSWGDVFALHFGRQLMGFLEGTLFSSSYDDLREKLEARASGRGDGPFVRVACPASPDTLFEGRSATTCTTGSAELVLGVTIKLFCDNGRVHWRDLANDFRFWIPGAVQLPADGLTRHVAAAIAVPLEEEYVPTAIAAK